MLSSSRSANRFDSSLDTQATLTIRNGTHVPNLAGMARDSLSLEKYLRVVAVEDAVNKNYKQPVVVVVVLNEAYEQHGIALARKYGVVPVIVPPQGEPIPQTDLLLILGQ